MIIRPNSNARFIANHFNVNIEIGNRAAAFLPRLTLNRFSNLIEPNYEAQVIIEHADRPGPPASFDGSIITSQVLNGKKHTFKEGPLGIRWEIDYNGRPSNDEEFIITLGSGLSLHHQLALTSEEIELDYIRPDEVVDSYAIYYNKSQHEIGGINYESGKFGHFYAMYLVDKDNPLNKIKVPYTINAGKIITDFSSVQSFIDATPNIILDPDFGYTSIGGTASNASNGVSRICELDAFPAGGGSITSITLYTNTADNSTRELIATLYNDSSGVPNNLVARSAAFFDATATPGWAIAPLISPYAAVASELLHVGRMQEAGVSYYYHDAVSGYNMPAQTSAWPAPPDPWGGSGGAGRRMSAYVTYSTAVAGVDVNINDAKHNKLSTALAHDGHIDDLELEWLQSFVAVTALDIEGAWHEYFDSLVIATGNFNDRAFTWLGGLGYLGSLSDRWYSYWNAP